MNMDMSSSSVAATATATSSHAHSTTASMHMDMTFYSSTTTPLYSSSWTPSSTAGYAFTCIFLIVLAILFRCLYAVKSVLEAKWAQKDFARRHIVVTEVDKGLLQEDYLDDTTTGARRRGSTEKENTAANQVVTSSLQSRPWRLSVDFPRAVLVTVMVGVGYLEMLAVMTMNIGYFFSVLGGAFIGELFVGRYSRQYAAHH